MPHSFVILLIFLRAGSGLLNTRIFRWSFLIVCFLVLAAVGPAANASIYEAELPPQLSSDPNMCKYVPCEDVLPGARSFSVRKGSPPYVEGYSEGPDKEQASSPGDPSERDEVQIDKETLDDDRPLASGSEEDSHVVGYVFLSTDIVDIPAYSGKPVVTLIGMDTSGKITGVKVLQHSEPILLVGIPEKKLLEFVKQYVGRNVKDRTEIGDVREGGKQVGIDAITGATVTAIAENRTIMRSAYRVAVQVGIVKREPKPPVVISDVFKEKTWGELVEEGSIQRLRVMSQQVELPRANKPWIDIYFGYLDQPTLGQNILGEDEYAFLQRTLASGDHAIFILGNGTYSFKGSGFVRGAIFDRIQLIQDDESFTFTDKDYYNISDVPIEGAPQFYEGGIFIVRKGSFEPAYPWSLAMITTTQTLGSKEKNFFTFTKDYLLPERYIIGERIIVKELPQWMRIWQNDLENIIYLLVFLLLVIAIFIFKRAVVQNRAFAKWSRYAVMAVSLAFVGFYKMAQPSVTQAVTLTQNFVDIVDGFRWDLFLSDPMIFILWWFIGITIVIWGRGIFCGWICPYGVLTEFSYRIFHKIFPKRFRYELPYKVHKRLVYLKYGVFGALVLTSFYSIELTEKYAEVEPFKTAFLVGPLSRSWPYLVYFWLLFAVCLVSYRFFCKYICPLGAGLAAPSTLSLLRINRREFCTRCTICTRSCMIGAINEKGVPSKRECVRCLECEENFWDNEVCPPLVAEKRKSFGTIKHEA